MFLCSLLLHPQIIFSELRILHEQPIQLSVQGGHGDFYFGTEFAHFPDLDIFFLSTKFLQPTLEVDSLLRTIFLVLDHMSALSHGSLPHLMMLSAGYRWLLKTIGVFGGRDCGGKVILDVEAVSLRGAVGSWAHNF